MKAKLLVRLNKNWIKYIGSVLFIATVLFAFSNVTFAAPVTFTDDFNRADGAVGNGWTVEGAAKKTYSILNNAVRGDDAATSAYNNSRLARQETSLDQTVTVDVEMGAVSASMGALLREHGTANGVSTAYYSAGGAGIGISKVVAGTATSLWSLGSGYNTTDTYRQKLSATGSNPTTLCLTVDNITTATNIVNNHCITDSTAQLQSAGKVALSIPKSTNLFDNFTFDYDAPDPVVPSAPTNLSATPASSQVALTWSAPSSDGGASITDYLVQYKETSSGSWSTFNDGVSATTGATVTSLTNGTQYDFRVYAINSVGQGASSSVVNATPVAGSLTHAVEPEDLWDNGYFLPLDNPKNSAFSRFIFNTTSDYVIINMITASGSQAPMGVKVDGVVQPSISAASNTINLGNLGQSKQVQITTGGNAGMTPVGNSLTTIKYNENSSFTVSPPQSVSDRVLIFGDSITIGSLNTDSPNSAITPRLRTAGYSVMSEGSAGDRLSRWNQGTATAPNFTNLTNRLVSYAPKTIWLEMGHNDGTALASDWSNSVNNFGNAYAMLVDGLHSALPNAHIFCQSTMKVDSTHRLVGDKILEVCNDSSRNTYAASVDAKGWITGYGTPGTYMADAIHPNDAGNVMYANRAEEFIRTLSTSLSKSAGSASFVENQASSDLEYTVADTATNNGAKLINRIAKIDLNGSLVNPSNYSISAGSNTIILSQSYLNTLSVGTKNLDVYFTGNIKTSSSFTVTQDNSTAPDAPTSLSATAGNTQVALSWSAPSSDGGSAITDYIVQYKETSNSTWSTFNDGTSTNTNATVTGLTNGTSYDFRVRAVNSVGEGANSSTASAKPATTPSAPSITATPEEAGIKLTWTAPTNGGESITDYTVQFKKTSDISWTTFSDGTNANITVTITGLDPDTSYDFRVSATNIVGTSNYSATETATTLANAVQLTNPESNQSVILTTPSSTSLTCHSTTKEANLTGQDSQFSYPLGLVDFCFDTIQTNNQVTLTFVTDLNPTDVIARKYNTTLGTFAELPSSSSPSITETTVDGQHALVLTYTIEDNGPLDLDNATGSIKDPVGLAVINTTSSVGSSSTNTNNSGGSLTNTGADNTAILVTATGLIVVSSIAYFASRKNQKVKSKI